MLLVLTPCVAWCRTASCVHEHAVAVVSKTGTLFKKKKVVSGAKIKCQSYRFVSTREYSEIKA
jgi:hypothetical protein